MRVIYFTYVQSTQYLRFYYKPAAKIDGVIVLNNDASFVYFNSIQENVQETLRVIDKDLELSDCRFSYNLKDLFFYLHKPHVAKTCDQTTRLLSNIQRLQLFDQNIIEKIDKSKVFTGSRSNSKDNNLFNKPFNFLN